MRRVIACIVIVVVSFNINLNEANETPECVPNRPDGIWQTWFAPFFRKRTYCDVILKNVNDKNQHLTSCRDDIVKYFNLNYEKSDVAEQFAKECGRKMGTYWSRCANIIMHFSSLKLCWNMATAPLLFDFIDIHNFLTDEKLRDIQLSHTQYVNFEKANIHLGYCYDDLKHYYTSTMDALYFYLKLRTEHVNSGKKDESACRCGQISGIGNIYRKRKTFELSRMQGRAKNDNDVSATPPSNSGKTSQLADNKGTSTEKKQNDEISFKRLSQEMILELSDLYRAVCLENENHLIRDFWTRRRLQIIADSVHLTSLPKLKNALIEIAKTGWNVDGVLETQWPLDFLLSKILIKGKTVDKLTVELVGQAIKSRFSSQNYEEFLTIVGQVHGFNSVNCATNIFNAIMNCADKHTSKWRDYYWRFNRDKHAFNEQLKLLLDLYSKTPRVNNSCKEFSDLLGAIEVKFLNTDWAEDHMNDLIKAALNSGMKYEIFYTCLSFAQNVEESTARLISNDDKKQGKYEWIPSISEQQDFRLKLFKNKDRVEILCESENIKYDKDNINQLLDVYKIVLKKQNATTEETKSTSNNNGQTNGYSYAPLPWYFRQTRKQQPL